MCSGRAEQSDGNHPCNNHKGDCEEHAHGGTQPPRDGTSGCEDGLVPSFVPTTIQPSEILHERFCLAKSRQSRPGSAIPPLRHAPCDDPSHTRVGPGWLACGSRADESRARRARAAILRVHRRFVGRSCVACHDPPCGIYARRAVTWVSGPGRGE